MDTDQEISRYL